MKSQRGAWFAILFTIATLCAARAATRAPDGNEVLVRAAAAQGLASYSVPVHFDVHMHHPIGIKTGVEGVAYYKAPARAAIAITKVRGPLGIFFKGTYTLDLIPQTWPAKYRVISVVRSGTDGAYTLTAVPNNDPSVDHVVFGVTADYEPVSAQWFYKDGSSIRLTIVNQHVQDYTVPQSEAISVAMRKYGLDATASYGTYAMNVPVSDSVFRTK